MKVLVINPGATSTKIAVFDEEHALMRMSIPHSAETLAGFAHVADQMPYRKKLICQALEENSFRLSDFDGVCGRGGMLRHIPSGTYLVDERVIQDVLHPLYGEHGANLGAYLAKELADEAGLPAFFVDPVSVDELSELARFSGLKGMERQSFFHALNHKSVARKAADLLGKPYETLHLIVAHLGGGVSVAAHENGRIVDVYNVREEGSMGIDRAGGVPINAVIDLCFSGKTQQQIQRLFGSEAGIYSYLGTKDFQKAEARAFGGDAEALLVFQALAYQLAKDMGAMAAVLHFSLDAIVLTGGMAHSDRLCTEISKYVSPLAPIVRFPGEEEMRSLAEGALRVLHGEAYRVYPGGQEEACIR